MSRNSHVEVNEPETLKRYLSRVYILSRICRYISSTAIFNSQSKCSCQKARRYSSIGDSKLEQATKTIRTQNGTNSQLRDSTASIVLYKSIILRKRSFHSSSFQSLKTTKGSSDINPASVINDNNPKKLVGKTKSKPTVKPINVTTLVRLKLAQFKKLDQKYYKLLDIVSDPFFLIACYEEIKGKKGNMTTASDRYTLDGLN